MAIVTRKSAYGKLEIPRGDLGFKFTGPLILNEEASKHYHAVTKEYIDSKPGELDASELTDGFISGDVLPDFNGDVVNSKDEFELVSVGEEREGTRPTVDSKGRVLNLSELDEGDIPELNWLLLQELPTDIEEYGIEDSLSSEGGIVGSSFKVDGIGIDELDLVNMSYLEDRLLQREEIPIGSILTFSSTRYPSGFLRCNGAILYKNEYPLIYEVIGNLFDEDGVVLEEDEFTLPYYPVNGKIEHFIKVTRSFNISST